MNDELLRERQELRLEILKLFKVKESKYSRSFPPVAACDTICRYSTSQERSAYHLLEKLKRHAASSGLSINEVALYDNKDDKLYIRRINLEVELSYVIRTIFPELKSLSMRGAHGYGLSYPDYAILKRYYPVKPMTQTFNGIEVKYSQNNKPIIRQAATRGCTAAATAMLICEHKKNVNLAYLKSRNLGDDEDMITDIQRAGLRPILTPCNTLMADRNTSHGYFGRISNALYTIYNRIQCNSLDKLKEAIKNNGSAILCVDKGIGGHVVVVDHITNTHVRIRDPYHGWEIDVSRKDFQESWQKCSNIIQIQ